MDVLGLAQLLAVGLALCWGAVVLRIALVLTHPPRRTLAFALAKGWPATPADVPGAGSGPRTYSEWSLAWRGCALPVWDIAGDRSDGPVVVFTHGWGESRLHGLSRLPAWAGRASRIILWDMPGHGDAPGICRLGADEHGPLVELVARVRASHPSAPVVLHGFSLGAGVSLVAAADLAAAGTPVRAVIAEAPYRVPQTPARAVLRLNGLALPGARAAAQGTLGLVWGHGLWWATRRAAPAFDRAVHAARLGRGVPLLVLAGEADEVCPMDDGRSIASAAGTAATLVVVPGAGHLDLWTRPDARAACERAVAEWLRQTGA